MAEDLEPYEVEFAREKVLAVNVSIAESRIVHEARVLAMLLPHDERLDQLKKRIAEYETAYLAHRQQSQRTTRAISAMPVQEFMDMEVDNVH